MDQFVKEYFIVVCWEILLLIFIVLTLCFAMRVHSGLALLASVGAAVAWIDITGEVATWARKRKEQLDDRNEH